MTILNGEIKDETVYKSNILQMYELKKITTIVLMCVNKSDEFIGLNLNNIKNTSF